jgi:hypothetical membrane protein
MAGENIGESGLKTVRGVHPGVFSGISLNLIFLLFLLTSIYLFPGPFDPFKNYLSDLGNYDYNPVGAFFFNIGCIMTGIILFTFYYSLKIWDRNKKEKISLVKIGQMLGYFNAFSLIMIGIFSENFPPWHYIWSGAFFISLTMIIAILSYGLYRHPSFWKFIAAYSIFVIISSLIIIISSASGSAIIIFEWISVFSGLGWAMMMALNILNFTKR